MPQLGLYFEGQGTLTGKNIIHRTQKNSPIVKGNTHNIYCAGTLLSPKFLTFSLIQNTRIHH